jgi:hypothetical protein
MSSLSAVFIYSGAGNKIERRPAPPVSPMAHEICMMNPILPAAFLDFDTPYNPGSITEIVEGDWKGCLRDQHGMVWASSGPSSFYYKPGWIESKRRAIVKFSISISSPKNKIERRPALFFSPMNANDFCYSCQYEFDTSNGTVILRHGFKITEPIGNGWVWCRLVWIYREYADGREELVEYDPATHDGTSHYMGAPYKARHNKKKGTLIVTWGDGTLVPTSIV